MTREWKKKIFLSGCFDLLHIGHIELLKYAAQYGDLYVGVARDETIQRLKYHPPIHSEIERLAIIQSIRYVKEAWISQQLGMMDFVDDVLALKPDLFLITEDSNHPDKINFCIKNNIPYLIIERCLLNQDLSSSKIRNSLKNKTPYRLEIAGAWLDQVLLNQYASGWIITISLEPITPYTERSGMATSTRKIAERIWPLNTSPDMTARILFGLENAPSQDYVSGSQDALGICMPGINRFYYNNNYWPSKMEAIHDKNTINWLEKHLFLIPLSPRKLSLRIIEQSYITQEKVELLACATENCWQAILNLNLESFGRSLVDSFNAQIDMFPKMLNDNVQSAINHYKHLALGYKLSGAGGGGYLIVVAHKPIKDALSIKIRQKGC